MLLSLSNCFTFHFVLHSASHSFHCRHPFTLFHGSFTIHHHFYCFISRHTSIIDFPLYFPIILPTASHSKRCSVVSNSCLHTICTTWFPKICINVAHSACLTLLLEFSLFLQHHNVSYTLFLQIHFFSKISIFSLLVLLFSFSHSSWGVLSFRIFCFHFICKASRLIFNSSASDIISLIRQPPGGGGGAEWL